MTKAQLYSFTSQLLDDYEMDTTLFNTLLDIAQMRWEGERPWVVLRKEDTSNSVSPGNTFETAKTLPTDFRRWYAPRSSIKFSDSAGQFQGALREIPLEDKLMYRDDNTKFYGNYATKQFFICGTPSQSYTVRLYYIKRGTKVSTSDDTTWDLDVNDEYSKILALTIAVYWKLGVDYDIINNTQANGNASTANLIFAQMADWDNELQDSTRQGVDFGTDQFGWTGNASGGTIGWNR